jgi:hypothetical protein
MDIDNLAIIKILMIKSRFLLDRLLLLSISNKRGFTARKNVHQANRWPKCPFFLYSLTANNTPDKELNCHRKGIEAYALY